MDNFYEEDEILEYDEDDVEVIDTPRTSLAEAAAKAMQAYSFDTSALSAAMKTASSALLSTVDISSTISAAVGANSALAEMVSSSAAISAASCMGSAISGIVESSGALAATTCAESVISEIVESNTMLSTASVAESAVAAISELHMDMPATSMVEAASEMISSVALDTSGVSSIAEAAANCVSALNISGAVGAALQSVSEAVKRVTDAIDFSGIASTLARMSELFSGMVERITERMTTILTATHSFFHWLIASFHGWFCNRKKKHPPALPYNVREAAIRCTGPCVKTLQVKFQEFAPRIRSAFLLHFHERGTSSDDDHDFLLPATCQ